jgi:serine/threonine protein kinase
MAQAGQNFGRYRLLDRLASGGMADVYRAQLVTTAGIVKPVVIKRIKRSLAQDEEFTRMFLEEARLAAMLSHGNIAQVMDVGVIDGEVFLALERVNGRTLAELIRAVAAQGKRMPPEYGALIAVEACKGLHYAHTRADADGRPLRIVHRDVSPQNVMISFEGEVKVVDFGIAKAYGDQRPGRDSTAAGIVKGKYAYFSPEQATAKPLDARSDVFAIGVMLYECACGRLPFDGEMYSVLARIVSGDFPPPRDVSPTVPEALQTIIIRAMATDPGARYPSALALQQALTTYLARAAGGMSQATLIDVMRWAFRRDFEAEGGEVALSAEFLDEISSWPVASAQGPRSSGKTVSGRKSQSGGARPKTSSVKVAAAPIPPPVSPGRAAFLAACAAGATAVLAGGGWYVSRILTAPEAPAVVDTVEVRTTRPKAIAVDPTALAQHGGKAIVGVQCQAAAHGHAKELAQHASDNLEVALFPQAIEGLQQAITAEPVAGTLYLDLARVVRALGKPRPDLAPQLESFLISCPEAPGWSTVQRGLEIAISDAKEARSGGDALGKANLKLEQTEAVGVMNSISSNSRCMGTEALLKHTVDVTPQDANARRMYANCLYDLKRGPQAFAQYQAFLALVPGDNRFVPEVRDRLAKLDPRGAAPVGMIQRREDLKHYELASKLLDEKKFDDASALLRVLTDSEPADATFRRRYGACLMQLGRTVDAAEQYKQFIALAPEDRAVPAIRQALQRMGN